ncbi:MAG: histidine kinase [Candidatus Limiplasma sp.]|nr:histidine kinase [Candidatus Limiplasma sp.]
MRAKRTFRVRHTTRSLIALALLVMTIVPCSGFVYWQYRNDNTALIAARATHQQDILNMMGNAVQQVVDVSRIAEQQVLEAIVVSNMFSGYLSMTPSERLYVFRQVNTALTSIRHANSVVENIYLIGVEHNSFTTNYYCDEAILYQQPYLQELSDAQYGVKRVIPTRKAEYCYRYKQYISPYVVSFVVHLNQRMKDQAISFSQVDIDFRYIRDAMAAMDTADGSFACILDADGTVVYLPEDRWLGLPAAGAEYGGVALAPLVDRAQAEAVFTAGAYTVRTLALANVPWRIVEVNADGAQLAQAAALQRNYLLTMLGLVGLSVLFSALIARGITHPIHRVIRRMEKVSAGDFSARAPEVGNRDVNSLSESFNRMVARVVQLMQENERKERARLTMEMTAKQSQINSHFLYNTLNTIKWMAISRGQEEIADVTVALVNLLEYSARDQERFVPVAQELAFVRDYLKIQEVRASCKVDIRYDIDPDVENCLTLKMLLQPAIENAILHGFQENGNHRLRITGRNEQGVLVFTVQDNGTGFAYQGLENLSGVGLNNVEQRIRLHYGDAYGITVQSVLGGGTTVTLRFPARKGEEGP